MANYFCTNSVEEQVDYLTDKIKELKTNKLDKSAIVQETGTGTDAVMSQKAVTDEIEKKSNATNLENGTGDVLIQTTDTNHSFKVMTDGRAKVQSAPVDSDDVVRKLELDGKLTTPTTPTAESAVTMLADGTVGTKPLSEIGGGGGKLYRHKIGINRTADDYGLSFDIYSNYSSAITSITKVTDYITPGLLGNLSARAYPVPVSLYVMGDILHANRESSNESFSDSDSTIVDTYIEL